jgi:hypothetical protein
MGIMDGLTLKEEEGKSAERAVVRWRLGGETSGGSAQSRGTRLVHWIKALYYAIDITLPAGFRQHKQDNSLGRGNIIPRS